MDDDNVRLSDLKPLRTAQYLSRGMLYPLIQRSRPTQNGHNIHGRTI
jgi:hypothetical protein